MKKIINVQLLKVVTTLTLGILTLLALHDVVLLVIALIAPAYWPQGNTLTTALPGFELPTVYLSFRPIYVGRQMATLALATLLVLPIAGIVRSLNTDGAFTSANIIRLRLLALGCGIYGLGPSLVPLIPMGVRIPLGLLYASVNVPAVAMALVALTLAEIFREGRHFRDDVQATI